MSRPMVTSISPTNRSAVTNGSRRHLSKADGRSREGRRFRDLMLAYAQPYGGLAALSEAEHAMVRTAAMLTLQSEAMQARLANGEEIDAEKLIRLGNVQTRVLVQLRQSRRDTPADNALDLHDYIARKAAP